VAGTRPLPRLRTTVMNIRITRLPHAADLPLPAYATTGAAGMDLRSAENLTIKPGARALVATGIAIALPEKTEAQVRPRSGLAVKHGITVLNAPGTIDWDYRGEIKVPLINLGDVDFVIARGDRIAQMVFARVEVVTLDEVTTLDETVRGDGGFGSSGRR
jgi:dUTP pyrophosphatase